MSVQALAAVLDTYMEKTAAKLLLLCLANAHNGHNGLCAPSLSRLQFETGMSRSSVHKWLGWLIDEGYIEVARRHDKTGRQLSNVYHLTTKIGVQTTDPREGPNLVPSQNSDSTRSRTLGGPNCRTPLKKPEEKPEKGARAQAPTHETGTLDLQVASIANTEANDSIPATDGANPNSKKRRSGAGLGTGDGEDGETAPQVFVDASEAPELYRCCSEVTGHALPLMQNGGWWFDASVVADARRTAAA